MFTFNIIIILKAVFAFMAMSFGTVFINDLRKYDFKKEKTNNIITGLIGGVAYFFDTLGIGSFATSTAMLNFFKQINYKNLPGTLNVTSVLPALLEAFIFTSIIEVDYMTISCMVIATCIGSWIGANFVHKVSEKHICLVLSVALFIAAGVLLLKQFNLIPANSIGTIGLTGMKLIIAALVSFVIGVLISFGIGSYAPFLTLALILGLNVRAIFPIMMSATSIGASFAGIKFIKIGNYDRKASLSMAVVGLFGVLMAAYLVDTLQLETLTWIVIGVIYYTSVSLFARFVKISSDAQNKAKEALVVDLV